MSGDSGLNEMAPRVSANGDSAAITSISISPPRVMASGMNWPVT